MYVKLTWIDLGQDQQSIVDYSASFQSLKHVLPNAITCNKQTLKIACIITPCIIYH